MRPYPNLLIPSFILCQASNAFAKYPVPENIDAVRAFERFNDEASENTSNHQSSRMDKWACLCGGRDKQLESIETNVSRDSLKRFYRDSITGDRRC